MDPTNIQVTNERLFQENTNLKNEIESLKKQNQELEFFKTKYLKHIDYQIKTMTEHMQDGPIKDDFIKLLIKMY